ncbi:MAG: 4,5-DOPA dioxygenase extradiol [Veillonellales bacterium]
MQQTMPALFIGHGSPFNAITQNSFTESLKALTGKLPKPEAILVISAHWLTTGTHVGCNQHPKTLYDFFGYPRKLYQLTYSCPGSPKYAQLIKDIVQSASVACDNNWGLDHAAWAVLLHIYPAADIPVLEMSLNCSKSPEYHYQLGAELLRLRQQGVLIIGSGNIVHNLRLANSADIDAKPFPWAKEFDSAVKNCLLNARHKALIEYKKLCDHADLAVPTNEHYLPLLYIIALQQPEDRISFIFEGIQNASVSMRSFMLGRQLL